jgi:hypothetical protein
MIPFALERPLTSEIGTPFLNADGFGISWHTDARSDFNPFSVLDKQKSTFQTFEANGPPLTNPVFKTDGPLIPFVLGPHPAIYKTTIAKPWVLVAFVARNLLFYFPFQAQ